MDCWPRRGRRKPIVERLNKELRAALASDEVRKRIIFEGAEPEPTTPEEHAAVIDQRGEQMVGGHPGRRPSTEIRTDP